MYKLVVLAALVSVTLAGYGVPAGNPPAAAAPAYPILPGHPSAFYPYPRGHRHRHHHSHSSSDSYSHSHSHSDSHGQEIRCKSCKNLAASCQNVTDVKECREPEISYVRKYGCKHSIISCPTDAEYALIYDQNAKNIILNANDVFAKCNSGKNWIVNGSTIHNVACIVPKKNCGKGGDLGAGDKCICKADFVDITQLAYLPEAKNFEKGDLCVPQNKCKGEEQVIIFVMDASDHTHRGNTFEGMKRFVRGAETLLDPTQNRLVFVAYGGLGVQTGTKVGKLDKGWNSAQFNGAVNDALAQIYGAYTNIADGFDRARLLLGDYDRSIKRIVIHVGDGIATDPPRSADSETYAAYDQLSSIVDKFIAVSVARMNDRMRLHWHTPGDYVDFTNVNYEDLDVENMRLLLEKVCKQPTFEELMEMIK